MFILSKETDTHNILIVCLTSRSYDCAFMTKEAYDIILSRIPKAEAKGHYAWGTYVSRDDLKHIKGLGLVVDAAYAKILEPTGFI